MLRENQRRVTGGRQKLPNGVESAMDGSFVHYRGTASDRRGVHRTGWLRSIAGCPEAFPRGPHKTAAAPSDRCRPETSLSMPHSVADVLRDHAVLKVEGIDRMNLYAYQPRQQADEMAAAFLRFPCGQPGASSMLMGAVTADWRNNPFDRTCAAIREANTNSRLRRVEREASPCASPAQKAPGARRIHGDR